MADLNSSGDPDVDAVFSGAREPQSTPSVQLTGDPDVDAVIHELGASKVTERPSTEIRNTSADEAEALGRGTIGGAEALAHAVSGRVMGAVGALGGHRFRDIEEKYTYEPRTPEGKALVGAGETASNIINRPGNWVTEKTGVPELGAATNLAIQLPFLGGAARAAPESAFGSAPQSVGAAATFPSTAVRFNQPELQTAFGKLKPSEINPEVLARHAEADALPVPMRLTPGQATGDPNIISREMNNRGATGLSTFLKDQNDKLVQNVQTIRDQAGPEVFSTNPVEHADTIIGTYKAKDAAAQADIASKYQELRDANGGKFPVDANQLLTNATANLHDKLLFDHAPKAVMSTLGRLADNGSMSFENFESLRTNLARIQRSSSDGNERAAAGVIRDAMEQMPLSADAAKLKPLADTARAAARAQFQALEADPAYKAAVNDTVPPDRFVGRYVINGARDDLAKMRENLAGNDQATQTLGVAAIDHLRQQAGIDPMGNGNFSQAGFNKHLQKLAPKMSSLVAPEQAQQLETLGNVARYTMAMPRGNVVNTSGTLSGAIAQGLGKAAVGAANYAGKGVPIGDWASAAVKRRSLRKELETATAPLGGVTRQPRE